MSRWYPIQTRYEREEVRMGHEVEFPVHIAIRSQGDVLEVATVTDLDAPSARGPRVLLDNRSVAGTIEQLALLQAILDNKEALKTQLRAIASADYAEKAGEGQG